MLINRAIKIGLSRPAPESIPLSGPRAQSNDYFVTYLVLPSREAKFLIKESNERGYTGILWLKGKTRNGVVLSPGAIRKYRPKLKIDHYFRSHEFEYASSTRFLLSILLQRHWFAVQKDKLLQTAYNRKRLVREERIEFLKYLVERTLEKPEAKFDPLYLGVQRYSMRWFYHPNRAEHQSHLKMLIESLVDSGDMARDGHAYVVRPKAMATLSEYEREEQQHLDSVSTSRTANKLTWAIVVLGVLGIGSRIVLWYLGPNP